jgi:hypothetical protein
MKVLLCDEPGRLRLTERPEPVPAEGEALVRPATSPLPAGARSIVPESSCPITRGYCRNGCLPW